MKHGTDVSTHGMPKHGLSETLCCCCVWHSTRHLRAAPVESPPPLQSEGLHFCAGIQDLPQAELNLHRCSACAKGQPVNSKATRATRLAADGSGPGVHRLVKQG